MYPSIAAPDNSNTSVGLAALMHNLVSSNLRAHQQYADWLLLQPAEALEQSVPSSFPGIKATLTHIWAAERFWITVLQQVPPPPWMNSFEGTIGELFNGLLVQSDEFMQYVHGLDEIGLLQDRHLDTPWAKGARKQYDFIAHCMSHSAYHRGQIVTMAHQLGIKGAPITDYNAFLMMN